MQLLFESRLMSTLISARTLDFNDLLFFWNKSGNFRGGETIRSDSI